MNKDTLCYNESMINICIIGACENISKSKNMCNAHYMMQWRGQPVIDVPRRSKRSAIVIGNIAKVPLGYEGVKGYAIVDAKDAEFVSNYKWSLGVRGYPVTSFGTTQKTIHRLLMGSPADGFVTDHKDRNKLNNRRDNLRFITSSQNNQNISKQKNNTSGYRGVWQTQNGNWKADIKVNYKKISLGTFADKDSAAKAYDKAATEHFGEFAVLNFGKTYNGTE